MCEEWNKDITLYLRTEVNKTVQWERRCFSRCFFKHFRSSEHDEKHRINGESYLARIPCTSPTPKVKQGSIAVLGNVSDVIEDGASGNDILMKYGENAFKVNTVSDNSEALFMPHIRIGN